MHGRDATDPFGDIPATTTIGTGGARLYTLPKGYYPMSLQITEVGATPVKQGTDGGRPFVNLEGTVLGGPFATRTVSRHFFLTPGQGPQLHFLRGTCHVLTGHGTDNRVLAAHGVTFTSPDAGERTASFVDWFLKAAPQTRIDLMVEWLCVREWNDKSAIALVDVEIRTNNQTGEQRPYNRYVGFSRMDDPEHGQEWLISTEYPRQAGVVAELRAQGYSV